MCVIPLLLRVSIFLSGHNATVATVLLTFTLFKMFIIPLVSCVTASKKYRLCAL